MGLRLYQVDAFTKRPFSGNPAAVCLLQAPLEDALMQNIAREMNLSETAFLVPGGEGYDLRWFTPASEVDLCGHATLATSHVLWETGNLAKDAAAVFSTRSGRLEARQNNGRIVMDFPSEAPEIVPIPQELRRAIPATVFEAGKNRLDYLVVLDSEQAVRGLEPDLTAIARLGVRGVIVTAASESGGYDFVSRYFAPQYGIPEDPVTGSAHCCLAPYWCERLGSDKLTGFQASARGGTVEVELARDRVLIGGDAVTVAVIDLQIE